MSNDVVAEQQHLREGLVLLQRRVEALEKRLAVEGEPDSASFSLSSCMPGVKRITEELFPGPFSCSDEVDPEYPNGTYVVINVGSTSDMADIVRRRCEWHDRIRALSPDLFGHVRLLITPH